MNKNAMIEEVEPLSLVGWFIQRSFIVDFYNNK